jgi:hypothetical protein
LTPASFDTSAGRSIAGDLNGNSQVGDFNSGIGVAWNSLLHCFAVHLAQFFDFLRRALSVEIPVPAYICR